MSEDTGGLEIRLLDAAVDLLGQAGRGGRVEVVGESMRPNLAPGDVLAVDFSPGPPRRGDLLLFRQAGYLVVHRLLGPARFPDGRPSHRTRGDGILAFDPHVDPANVVGRAIAQRRADGWRDRRGAGPRLYGWAVAWHDFAWGVAGIAARRVERAFGRKRSLPLMIWVQRADRWLLGLGYRIVFKAMHRRIRQPVLGDETGEERTG